MEIGAFAVFLSWMVFLLFIQKVPMIGIYVAMFVDVVSTFAGFIPILAIFVVGFSFAFHILMGNQVSMRLFAICRQNYYSTFLHLLLLRRINKMVYWRLIIIVRKLLTRVHSIRPKPN